MAAAVNDNGLDRYLSAWRRRLHAAPELSFQEKETARAIAAELKRMGIQVRAGVGGTGVVGTLTGRNGGSCLALRADMDALPVHEETGRPYRSKIPDRMHACGHDAHCAMLLGAARLLSYRRSVLKGTVKFLFQPGEETPPGGALGMIRDGALENPKVDAVFGLHVDSSLPTGKVGVRVGPMMAASDNFRILVKGRGGHAARPHDCLDPVLAASQIVAALQSIVSRRVDPAKPAVVTVGRISGGTKHNIIPETVELEGTARSIDVRTARMMPAWISRIAENTARAAGLRASVDYERGYPVLSNDPRMAIFAKNVVVDLFGRSSMIEINEPLMGGEDFAYYLKEAPGAFLRLGSRSGHSTSYPWHHPKFDIDERAMPVGARLLAGLAERFLGNQKTKPHKITVN
jgi:amidohydrolase